MTIKDNIHIPVLAKEVCIYLTQNLDTAAQPRFFDGTLGGGGYSSMLASILESEGIVNFCITSGELDRQAIESFQQAKASDRRFKLLHGNFAKLIADFETHSLAGIMLDLGFSSNQLENSGRGFSYMHHNEPLDLRYNTDLGRPTLKDKLRRVQDPKALTKILFNYSGEKLSPKFAELILERQKKGQLKNVGDLSDTIGSAIPAKLKKNKYAIMSRVWQALRIWVNEELDSLEKFLPIAVDKLAPGGRLAIVSFHSLEDKLVTKFMRQASKPLDLDDYGNKIQYFKLLTPKGITPSEEEILNNVRSRSGLLRILEKIDTAK